ncbi:hypothetical protein ACFV0R_18965 [Streptomyces sp. NPDC059578]|uniref:hypothetical protein n=1 Tax=Streptomyces sp. NPDC059578 TaxID=3346874 RepID=UPI0036B39BD6
MWRVHRSPPGWPLPGYGLWVDCGHQTRRGHYWLREPTALYLCRHGCVISASGAERVTHLTTHLTELHANCPGTPTP